MRVALTLARRDSWARNMTTITWRIPRTGAAEEVKLTGKPPRDGPWRNDIRHGFVYERAPHVTLESIANNAEIDVIWERFQSQAGPLRAQLNAG